MAGKAHLRAHLQAHARRGASRRSGGGQHPSGLLSKLQAAGLAGDAFRLGGQRTLRAFLSIGAIDRLELLQLPILLGQGVPFSPAGTPQLSLRLHEHHAFADGTIHPVYQPANASFSAQANARENSIA